MKRILILIIGLIGVAYGQSNPTSSKTRFVNGLYVGTKLDSYFAAADSNAIYWRADSVVMAKYKGAARALAFAVSGGYMPISDTAAMLSGYKTYYPRTAISAGTGISYNAATGVITNSSPSSGGTVTSVATNNGSGITGGTITSTGTIAADTSILSTKANVNGLLVGYTATGRFLDSLTNVQSRIQTKQPLGNYLTFADSSTILAGRWLPNRSSDSIAVIRALANTKQPIGNYITFADSTTILAGRWLPNRSADSIAVIRALANTKGVGTVTSVAASAGTGISVSGSPITSSGTITITNTAPDQTVTLTAGTGISVSGTYPNFTVTNSSPSSGGTVTSVGLSAPTGFSVSGSPVTSSGTLALSFAAGYSLPTDASQTNWNTAFNKRLSSASASSTTLTLTLADASTVTTAFPTFNQNTTGTAGSLSAVLSKTLGGAGDVNGIMKANGTGTVSAVVAGDITSLISGTYLPLSGGTLTGALNGTSLSMSGGISGSSVNASSGGMSAQSFIRSLGAVFQLRNVGNTVTYGGLTTSGYWEGNSNTDVGIFAETTFGINLYSGGSTAVRQRISPAGNTLIKTTTDNGTDALQVAGSGLFIRTGAATALKTVVAGGGYQLLMENSASGNYQWGWYIDANDLILRNVPATTNPLTIASTGAITASSSVTASSLIKSGGTSSQFLKADGSVDGNTYLTSASITGKLNISDTTTMLSNYARLSGANFTGSIGSTRGVFNNSTQSQLEIFGWNNIQGASTNAGEIRFGGTESIQGRLIYSSAGNSTLYLDNTFDNANAEIKLRTRVAGTAVDALTLTSTAATFASSATATSFIRSGGTSSQFLKADGSVDGNTYLTSAGAVTSLTGTTNQITVSASTGAVTVSLPSAVTISGAMTASGFIVSSDLRYKNILSQDGDLYKYTLKADETNQVHYGYIAQEVEKTLPEVVSTNAEGYKAVNYIEVHAIKIRELEKQIEELKKLIKK